MGRRSQQQRSSVSPMSQVILERSNTSSLAAHLVMAASHVQSLDQNILMAKDQKAGAYTSFKGILSLFCQWRVGALLAFHLAVTLSVVADDRVRASYVGIMGSYGSTTILGWVVGLMIAFRQDQGMIRWWEGRSAWGRLTNVSRDVVRAVMAHNNDKDTSMSFAMYTIAFSITMKNFLRDDGDTRDSVELKPLLGEVDLFYVMQQAGIDRVLAILDLMSGILVQMTNKASMDPQAVLLVVEPKISEMNHIMGTAWRIKDTPLPQPYRVFLDLVVIVFLTTLPFALLSSAWAPWSAFFICTAISCMLNGLAKLAGQMEDPFETDPNDLPLGKYTAAILHQVMRTTDRWYRPNSILHASKVEQKRKHDLDEKLRRAQIKASVVGRLRASVLHGPSASQSGAKRPSDIPEEEGEQRNSGAQSDSGAGSRSSQAEVEEKRADKRADSEDSVDTDTEAGRVEAKHQGAVPQRAAAAGTPATRTPVDRANIVGTVAQDAVAAANAEALLRVSQGLGTGHISSPGAQGDYNDDDDDEEVKAVVEYLLEAEKHDADPVPLAVRSQSTPNNIASTLSRNGQ